MHHSSSASPSAVRVGGLGVLTLALATLAVGCAKLPMGGAAPQIKPPQSFQSAEALKAPATDWPTDQWWTKYEDPQLSTLINEALGNSPDLAAAVARLKQADAAARIVGSARKPQLGVHASASSEKQTYNWLYPQAMLPQGWNDYGRATLDFSWELDFWGRNRAALVAATSEHQARYADLAQARLVLAASIAGEYAELSRLYANRDTALKALEIRRKTAELFAQRFANGLETKGGLRGADARRAVAEGALLALDEQIALQRNRLAALLGAGPDRGLAITPPTLKRDRSFGLPAQVGLELIGRRPDIVASRLQAEAAASRIKQAKAEFYPNVNLSAFFGVQSLGLDQLFKHGSTLGSVSPAISLPVFSGGRLRGQLRGAEAAYAEAVAGYNGTIARALQEVADNAVSQRALGDRLAKAQEAVDAASEAHRVANNRYQGGLANYLEVLSAEDVLLGSLDTHTNLCALSLSLDIALQRTLGGGYQQPEKH